MKAIKINGQIKTFFKLPKTWKDENGTYLNFDKLSNTELHEKGFYDVVRPEYNSKIQKLSPPYFNGSEFTYNILDVEFTKTLEELKQGKIEIIKRFAQDQLSKTDWYVVRNAENNKLIPQEILDKRQAIRDESNIKEADVMALTTKREVVLYE